MIDPPRYKSTSIVGLVPASDFRGDAAEWIRAEDFDELRAAYLALVRERKYPPGPCRLPVRGGK